MSTEEKRGNPKELLALLLRGVLLFGLVLILGEPLRYFAVQSWLKRVLPSVIEMAKGTEELREPISQTESKDAFLRREEARWSLEKALLERMRTLVFSNFQPGRVEFETFRSLSVENEVPLHLALLRPGERTKLESTGEMLEFSPETTKSSGKNCLLVRVDILLHPFLPVFSPLRVSSGEILLPCP